MAAGTKEGDATFYTCRQVSTLMPAFRDSAIATHGVKYGETTVHVRTLTNILFSVGCPNIDFLSIDCEGMDIDVLNSIDLNIFKPKLICMEIPTNIEGYYTYKVTRGNTLYAVE
jgi:FkbM family methyltransferase